MSSDANLSPRLSSNCITSPIVLLMGADAENGPRPRGNGPTTPAAREGVQTLFSPSRKFLLGALSAKTLPSDVEALDYDDTVVAGKGADSETKKVDGGVPDTRWVRADLPPERVFIRFSFARFFRTFIYNTFYPFANVLVWWIDGKTAIRNMIFDFTSLPGIFMAYETAAHVPLVYSIAFSNVLCNCLRVGSGAWCSGT